MPKINKKFIAIGGIALSAIAALGSVFYFIDNEDDENDVEKKESNDLIKNDIVESKYDKYGFDCFGYNSEGYDRRGYNVKGYNKQGFNRRGYNEAGFNRKGFNINGYNIVGLDICSKQPQDYVSTLKILDDAKEEAFKNLQSGNEKYALYNCRGILDDTTALILKHYYGERYFNPNMKLERKLNKIKELDSCRGMDMEFIERCHEARKIVNPNMHTMIEINAPHNKVHFVVMQTKELIEFAKKVLLNRGVDNEQDE